MSGDTATATGWRVEVVGSIMTKLSSVEPDSYPDWRTAIGAAMWSMQAHMHAPGTVMLIHPPPDHPNHGREPTKLTLQEDRRTVHIDL